MDSVVPMNLNDSPLDLCNVSLGVVDFQGEDSSLDLCDVSLGGADWPEGEAAPSNDDYTPFCRSMGVPVDVYLSWVQGVPKWWIEWGTPASQGGGATGQFCFSGAKHVVIKNDKSSAEEKSTPETRSARSENAQGRGAGIWDRMAGTG